MITFSDVRMDDQARNFLEEHIGDEVFRTDLEEVLAFAFHRINELEKQIHKLEARVHEVEFPLE